MPPTADCTSLQWPDKVRRSIIFPEDAFDSCEDADADAISSARRQIQAMNGSTVSAGRRITDGGRNKGARQESDESLAAQYEISFDGKRYVFRQHCYDVFQDALRFAVTQYAKAGFLRDEAFQPSWAAAHRPTDEDECTMRLHGIDYVEGHFLYGGCRYGQLCDAVAFAAEHPNL